MSLNNIIRILGLLSILLISACSDPLDGQINQQLPLTEQRIESLAMALNSGQVRNANLMLQYADRVAALKPDLKPLINEFKKESTTSGPMFLSLTDRLKTLKEQPQMFASKQARLNEAINLYQAADPILFSDALSDPLNVLADMSDGALPRVNSLSKEQSKRANNAQDFGVGEQLIGNPNYGQWTTGSNGMSFWAWYGMYSMIGDVFGGRRTYYSDWGRNRNYSYYNDYGRNRYSSPNQLKRQNDLDTRTKKSFAQRGQRFDSAYSKNRTGGSSLSSKSRQAQASANKFRNTSNTPIKSKYSSNSSFRNSSTSTSRSFKRGK